MKKALPILATIFFMIGILGYGFKIMHWPGAGILLVLSSLIMMILLSIWFFMKKRLLFDFVFWIFGLVFFAAYLFKLQHWPGSDILTGILPLISLLLITMALIKK